MINVLCDGNYIFHKTFGVFAGYGSVDPAKILNKKSDQAMFIRKVATDLCAALKYLPQGGRMVFTSDSRSWRKEIEIEDGGYKSNRVKDENVDWTIFFELMDSFGLQLEKSGFIYSKSNGAEGDDLLYAWSRHFNSIGEDCVILTGDKDLHQITSFNGKNWTVTWNSNSKNNIFTAPFGWKEGWLEKEPEVSIFEVNSFIDPEKEKMKEFAKKIPIGEVETKNFILNKVLIGDKGDAVPPVWTIKNGSKVMNLTEKKSESVLNSFFESEFSNLTLHEILENESCLNCISGTILRVMKDVDSEINRKKVSSNIIRNFTLVWLDERVIPHQVWSGISDEIERGLSLPKKTITIDRIKILEGTTWVAPTLTPSSFDPFNAFK